MLFRSIESRSSSNVMKQLRLRWAYLFGFLCALDPLQLLYERYVMTEAISLFLYAVDSSSAPPTPLLAVRQVKRAQDLRYAAMIYNAKLKAGKPQVRSQMIISQAGKILLREPEQAVEAPANGSSPVVKIGQFGTAKVPKGKYVLTLVMTDTQAEKRYQILSRSIDFNVVD